MLREKSGADACRASDDATERPDAAVVFVVWDVVNSDQACIGVAGASVPELFEPMLRGPIRARSADGSSAQRHTAPVRSSVPG